MDRTGEGRALRVDGLVNGRDLGGLRRRDGSCTPRGVFYRSESVDRISPTGWQQIRALGVRTVVDLRQPTERSRSRGVRPNWLHTVEVDLDGLDNAEFWADYWDNGLAGTALYFLPHLRTMPDRAGAVLTALVTAPPGGVLFHCAGGRDRTGMIAMLLLAAVDTLPAEIVEDYLESVRLADQLAAATGRANEEAESDAVCRRYGSSTEQAIRQAVLEVDVPQVLATANLSRDVRSALLNWRGSLQVRAADTRPG